MAEAWEAGEGRHPYFFLSYAHTPRYSGHGDPDSWVARLFRDLCDHVMALTDLPAGAPVGFMDREMAVGEGWPERLAEALANCRIFVPLYSPRYFSSQACGREWYAFSRRGVVHGTREGRSSSAIVPALWVPVDPGHLPEAAAGILFDHTALGRAYASEGLYGLIKLRYLRDEYERAVYGLARQIVSVANTTSLAPGHPSDYHEMPSAFDARSRGQRLKIVVVAARDQHMPTRLQSAYGRTSADWNPYYSVTGRPLAAVAADLAASLSMPADVHSFEDVVESLLDGRHSNDGPVLLLLDRWALHEPELRAKLSLLDAKAPAWTRVMIPWDKQDNSGHDDAPDPVELETVIPELLRLGRSASRSAVSGVGTLETFCEIFPIVMGHASSAFARHTANSPSDVHPLRPGLRAHSPFREAPGDRTP